MGAVPDLPDPGFAGDDGSADPALVEALTAYEQDPDGRHAATLVVLQQHRLLVPVVALLGEVELEEQPDGSRLARDKTSDMATVLMRGRDGRTALLAFTGTESLRRWNAEARPVPTDVRRAAAAAVQDGAEAMLVDVAGPVLFVVETDDLRALADGQVLVALTGPDGAVSGYGWATPDR